MIINLTQERYSQYLDDPEHLRCLIQDAANTSEEEHEVRDPNGNILFIARPGEDIDLQLLLEYMEKEIESPPIDLDSNDGVVFPSNQNVQSNLCAGAPVLYNDLRSLKTGDLVWVTWYEGAEPDPLVDTVLPVTVHHDHAYYTFGDRFCLVPQKYDWESDDEIIADGYLRREYGSEEGELELYFPATVSKIDIHGIIHDPNQLQETIILGLIAQQSRRGIIVSYEDMLAQYIEAKNAS